MTKCGEWNGVGNDEPGKVLSAAHALWTNDREAPPSGSIAELLGVRPEAFEAIVAFHRRIVTRPADEPLVLCRGVSCRLHGAEAVHSALRAQLEAAGVLGRIVEVHCLSHCDHGPNMKLGSQVLCLGMAAVVTDDRPWRPETAGPKPVQPPSPNHGS